MPHLDFIQQCTIQISHSLYSFDGLVNVCLLGQQLEISRLTDGSYPSIESGAINTVLRRIPTETVFETVRLVQPFVSCFHRMIRINRTVDDS